MMRPDAKVEKVFLYPKPVDFRKSINGLAALVELDIKSGGVRPRALRVSEQNENPRENPVLGAKRLLTLAQAPRLGTLQNIA